jgi:hypothetical protein
MQYLLGNNLYKFTKVVVFSTRSLTKLGLNFSTIFYRFSKNQQKSFTIGDSLFRTGPWKVLGSHKSNMPLVCTKGPETFPRLAMQPLGMAAGGSGRIPARSSPGRVGNGWRMGRGLPRAGLWQETGSGMGSAATSGAGRWSACSGEATARPRPDTSRGALGE